MNVNFMDKYFLNSLENLILMNGLFATRAFWFLMYNFSKLKPFILLMLSKECSITIKWNRKINNSYSEKKMSIDLSKKFRMIRYLWGT